MLSLIMILMWIRSVTFVYREILERICATGPEVALMHKKESSTSQTQTSQNSCLSLHDS